MSGIISEMLELFEIGTVPTSFPDFMFWLCSLVAGISFLKFTVFSTFKFVKDMVGASR